MKKISTYIVISTIFFAVSITSTDGSSSPLLPFKPIKFAVIADPHISDPLKDRSQSSTKMYEHNAALLRAAVQAINKVAGLDFAVVLGDLTRDAEPWNVKLFKEIMDGLTSPYYVILGNHDINHSEVNFREYGRGQSRSYMINEYQGHGFSGPGAHWSLDPLPNVHLVGLDTNIKGDWGGELSLEGIKFLKKDLSENSEKLTIVMLHHQLLPYTRAARDQVNDFHKFVAYNGEEVRLILQGFPQVVMTLSGHRHLSTRFIKEKNISYFTCPSTAVWPMRYAIFEISSGSINYSTHDVVFDPEVRREGKSRVLAEQAISWKREKDFQGSPGSAESLAEMLRSDKLRTGTIPLNSSLSSPVSP